MLDRRQMVITSAGALTMTTAPGLVPKSIADDYDRTWMHELHWRQGNCDDGHQWETRLPVSDKFQMRADYGDVPAYGLDTTVFHGGDWHKPIYGLDDYYNTRDVTKAQCAINVLDAGDRSPYLTSVWFVVWNEHTVSLVTPDGQPVDPHENSKMALAIKDWRYAARVANLDFFKAAQEPPMGASRHGARHLSRAHRTPWSRRVLCLQHASQHLA